MNPYQTWLIHWFCQRNPALQQRDAAALLELDYFQNNLLDSMGIIELIAEMEGHFDVQFTDEHFNHTAFYSMNGLADLIQTLQGEGA
ncbi:hypothetical protein Mmc1_1158 [Magnetococcus marinus MC-1]|uniref:Carrier domain-containing protein n=1 Tax=Magnetococcus marinus (strain ATCC BAA-1437 / JCM 17883 / MC-1) TaxID=156889 RepID=A0L6S6_MAGMM|nr:acyl carrier protein [Magnetococcus marinus]ABK43669.1 hypothetical protein Mmc1_1158 [Magnetococcus marinus MC-1]